MTRTKEEHTSKELRTGIGAHARIRTGDLFLTKWPAGPGEYESILKLERESRRDHLTRTT
jgi:hypothetical protein